MLEWEGENGRGFLDSDKVQKNYYFIKFKKREYMEMR